MQVVAAALLKRAALGGAPLLLAGGSQMAAVWALAMAACRPEERQRLVRQAAVVTTAWVAHESASDFPGRWRSWPAALALSRWPSPRACALRAAAGRSCSITSVATSKRGWVLAAWRPSGSSVAVRCRSWCPPVSWPVISCCTPPGSRPSPSVVTSRRQLLQLMGSVALGTAADAPPCLGRRSW